MAKANTAKSTGGTRGATGATAQKPNGLPDGFDHRTSRQVDADLAAMEELYALLVACKRNNGLATLHQFECSDAIFDRMIRVAEHQGFAVQVSASAPRAFTVAALSACAQAAPVKAKGT